MKFRPDWEIFRGAYLYLLDVSKKEKFDQEVRSNFSVQDEDIVAELCLRIHQALMIVFTYVDYEGVLGTLKIKRYPTIYASRGSGLFQPSAFIHYSLHKKQRADTDVEDFWDGLFRGELKSLLSDLDRHVVDPARFFIRYRTEANSNS